MKRNGLIALIFIAAAAMSITGCKKDAGDNKDYSSLFKNTFWIGEFHNTDKQLQPTSIEFKEDGQLIWEDILGTTPGSWTLDNEKITITLVTKNSFTANVTADSKLSNIQGDPSNVLTLKAAELNTATALDLVNTKWTASNLVLNYTGNSVNALFGPTGSSSYVMSYNNKGRVVTFNNYLFKFFMVITSASTMKGVNHWPGDPNIYPFEVTKK